MTTNEISVVLLILGGLGALAQTAVFFVLADLRSRIRRLENIFMTGCRYPTNEALASNGEA